MKTAVVFLCKEYNKSVWEFAKQIKQKTSFDPYIIIDEVIPENTGFSIKDALDGPATIHVSEKYCIEKGYHKSNIKGSTHIQKDPIAMDKFLYMFCEHLKYDFIWCFEDDVFIPKIETIVNLHEKYSSFDLITPNNFYKDNSFPDWHWPHIFKCAEPPYYYSMVCAMGMSSKMLDVIKKQANEKKELFFIEAMFNTLAMQDKDLRVTDAFELKSVVWMGDWGIDEFLLLPNNVFHPRKDIDNHFELREKIETCKQEGYVPKNKLPNFIKQLM